MQSAYTKKEKHYAFNVVVLPYALMGVRRHTVASADPRHPGPFAGTNDNAVGVLSAEESVFAYTKGKNTDAGFAWVGRVRRRVAINFVYTECFQNRVMKKKDIVRGPNKSMCGISYYFSVYNFEWN